MAESDKRSASAASTAVESGNIFFDRILNGIISLCVPLFHLAAAKYLPVWLMTTWIVLNTILATIPADRVLRDYIGMGPVVRLLACTLWITVITLILRAVPHELAFIVHETISGGLTSAVSTYAHYYQLDGPSYAEGQACVIARDRFVMQILVIISYTRWTRVSVPVAWMLRRLVPTVGCLAITTWLAQRMNNNVRIYVEATLAFIRQNIMRFFWWQDFGDAIWTVFFRAHHTAIYNQIHKLAERKREMHIDLPVYEYRPLKPNQIRLLVIHPIKFEIGPVFEASLHHANISDLPAYEAISYRWGDDTKTDEIIIDYQSFRVTKSATEVLLSRRRWFRPRTIWLDAICINQSDPEEKASQVQLMRHIYSQAYRVVLCPSYEPELRLVAPLLNEEATAWRSSKGAVSFWSFRPLLANGNFTPRWKAYRDLIVADYFRRAWILQEIVVAKEVQLYLNGFYVPWHTFIRAVARFLDPFKIGQLELAGHQDESVTVGGTKTIQHVLNDLIFIDSLREEPTLEIDTDTFNSRSHRKLEYLYDYAFNVEAGDARDYVFSMVGLAKDVTELHKTLKPDYRKPAGQIFEDVAQVIFVENDRPSLLLLRRAGIGYSNTERSVPSWVPDPSERHIFSPQSQLSLRLSFQACGHNNTEVESRITSPGKLKLKGFLCGTLAAISEIDLIGPDYKPGTRYPVLPLMRNKLTYVSENLRFVQQQKFVDPLEMRENMYRVFVADHVEGKAVTQKHKQIFAEFLSLLSRVVEAKDYKDMVDLANDTDGDTIWAPTLPSKSPPKLVTMAYNNAFTATCIGRRIAISSAGQCCLVPIMSRPGDEIFIPCGSMIPYVIRRDSNANSAQLVGDAYVNGIMYGEAVSEKSEATWVTLR